MPHSLIWSVCPASGVVGKLANRVSSGLTTTTAYLRICVPGICRLARGRLKRSSRARPMHCLAKERSLISKPFGSSRLVNAHMSPPNSVYRLRSSAIMTAVCAVRKGLQSSPVGLLLLPLLLVESNASAMMSLLAERRQNPAGAAQTTALHSSLSLTPSCARASAAKRLTRIPAAAQRNKRLSAMLALKLPRS